MLRIDNCTTGYGRIRVLDQLSLEVKIGDVLAIIGPNGAGKSTLLNLICGALPVWSGQLHFDGEDLCVLDTESRAEAGLICCPEGRRIFSTLSIEENLLLGAEPTRRKDGDFAHQRRQSLEQIYALFPVLKQRRKSSGGALSGGQQQMLAIGRSLMGRPKILLLDEPSLGLSPVIADQVYEALAKLKQDGLTLLIVEEAAGRPLKLADWAIVMREGKIVHSSDSKALAMSDDFSTAYFGSNTK